MNKKNKETLKSVLHEIQDMKLPKAIKTLVTAMNDDEGYQYTWQANIAVCMQDAYKSAKNKDDIYGISNDGAKRFLDLLKS
jgi:hypothetical protein